MKTASDPRHNSRKVALGALFCWLFSEPDMQLCTNLSQELLEIQPQDFNPQLTTDLIQGTKQYRQQIDQLVMQCAPEWPIDKIAKIDLIILRIAIFEIMYYKKAPEKVVIDEAVELAKEFGNDTASKFVNGVLGTVVEIITKTSTGH